MKQADLRDVFQKVSKNVCTSAVVVSPGPSSSPPSMYSAMDIPEHIEEDAGDPE
jgi:hypothetical protein